MVCKAKIQRRSWIGRLLDKISGIQRIPLFDHVECVLHVHRPARFLVCGELLLLANGTNWEIAHVNGVKKKEQIYWLNVTIKSLGPLTSETLQQMQHYEGDALAYAIAANKPTKTFFNLTFFKYVQST